MANLPNLNKKSVKTLVNLLNGFTVDELRIQEIALYWLGLHNLLRQNVVCGQTCWLNCGVTLTNSGLLNKPWHSILEA